MSDRLTITIDGVQGDLDATAFTSAVNSTLAILRILEMTERQTSGASIRWRIVSLAKKSPATLEIEGTVKSGVQPGTLVGRFLDGVASIENGTTTPPRGFSDEAIEKTKHLFGLLNKRLESIRFSSNGRAISPTQHAAANAADLLGRTGYRLEMSVDGWLDAINAHGSDPKFVVFDPITDKAIQCIFPNDRLDEVIALLKQRVRAYGLARFNKRDDVTSMIVDDFERLPDQDEVPSMKELHDAGLNITDGEDSQTYIARMRDDG